MKQYFNVKRNNGTRSIMYAEQDELEAMYQAGIIDAYVLDSGNLSIEDVYKEYVCEGIEEKVHDLCYNIQQAKGIHNGELPPDLGIDLSMAIEKVYEIVDKIIKVEQSIDKEEK